jgi:cystathionine gamma-synthase
MDDSHKSIVRRTALPDSVGRPVVTPLYPSVVYRSESPDQLDAIYEGKLSGYTYAREGHPNATVLAEKIDWLEGATGGVVTGSGMAAVSAVFLGLLSAGDHILAGDQLYGRSSRLLVQDLPRMGFRADLVDSTDAAAMESAIRPETRMIFVEVVANPTLRVADMKAIAAIARKNHLLLVVDNTFTTPRAFRPLEHGADIVLHSITKLLAGHSDVTLGYVVAKDDQLNQSLRDAVVTWGLTPSPWDCWLAERGLHSFDLRFERVQQNAAALANFLAGQPGVAQVLYPGRSDHPDHERACALLGENFGNIVSFRLAGGRAAANALTLAAPHLAFAPTLGDIGTTLSHPASSSHRALRSSEREALGMTEGFFRVSVGIENVEQLKRELGEAIKEAMTEAMKEAMKEGQRAEDA